MNAVAIARFASVTCFFRSDVSAVASTWPFLTASPTLTLTSVAVHVVDPLEAAAVVLARCAGEPNARPYEALDATLPVAATSLVTLPVAAAPVRYWVVAALLDGSPPTATTAAPMPTTARPTMARILSFMDVSRDRSMAHRARTGALRTFIWRRDSETGMRNRLARVGTTSARAGTRTAARRTAR